MQKFYRVLYGFLPLGCKFAVPFPVIVHGLLRDPRKPSCESRRICQTQARQKFRSPYESVTRARTRVGVIRVKPLLKEFRAFLEMIFRLLLELAGEFQCDSLGFTESRRAAGEGFIDEDGSEAELVRIWGGSRCNLRATICSDLAPSRREICLLIIFVGSFIVITVCNFTHPVVVDDAAICTATASVGWIYVNDAGAVGGTFGALHRGALAWARIFGLGHNASPLAKITPKVKTISAPSPERFEKLLNLANNCGKPAFLSYFRVLPSVSYHCYRRLFPMENQENSGQRESNPHCQLGRLELYH